MHTLIGRLVFLVSLVAGFPSGAPSSQCVSMRPEHASAVFSNAAQTGPVFRLSVEPVDPLTYRGNHLSIFLDQIDRDRSSEKKKEEK